MLVAPFLNATVPVGIDAPDADVTAALSETGVPAARMVADAVRRVVVSIKDVGVKINAAGSEVAFTIPSTRI